MSDQDLSDSSGCTAERPSLAEIADVFARYGNFTLGGGSATSAVIHGQIVTRRRWVNDQQFTICFALGRLTPGTNVLAFCTGIGWVLRGLPGAMVALLAASIPCTVIVIASRRSFVNGKETPSPKPPFTARSPLPSRSRRRQAGQLRGLYRGGAQVRVVLIGGTAFGLYVVLRVPAIYVLLGAALVGAFLPVPKS
jgi:chromate transporter